eukprot:UN12219
MYRILDFKRIYENISFYSNFSIQNFISELKTHSFAQLGHDKLSDSIFGTFKLN